ncbi:MAG: hypothetical protein ACOX0Z_02840 [Candidatus Nanosyncoccaceae bacterium]|jgi:tetratricopeptide (TPR) repeat protein
MDVRVVEKDFNYWTRLAQKELEKRSVLIPSDGDLHVANAIQYFLRARKCAYGDSEIAQAEQNLGIAYRLSGSGHSEAEEHFSIAYQIAESAGLKARLGAICRDWAMLYLVRKDYANAHKYIDEALEIFESLPAEKCELAATYGFKARMGRGDEAIELFIQADNMLRGRHDQYERNNLRHLLWAIVTLPRVDLFAKGIWFGLRWIRLEFRIRTGRSDGK